MDIKYPKLINVYHSKKHIQKRVVVMAAAIIVLSILLCMSAKADVVGKAYAMQTVEVGVAPPEAEAVANPYQTIPISDSEFNELRWVLALEAQGEGYRGEVACCEAILNRCLSQKNNWGGSLHGVLSKKKQFSTYRYIGSSKAWAVPGEMEDDVISEVLRSGLTVLPRYSYVYFDSKGGVNGKNKFKLGHHTFGEE